MKCNKNTKAKLLRGAVHSALVAGAIVSSAMSCHYMMEGGIGLLLTVVSIGFALAEWMFIDTIRKMDGKTSIMGMIIGSTRLNDKNVETCVEEVVLRDGNIIYFDAYVMDADD